MKGREIRADFVNIEENILLDGEKLSTLCAGAAVKAGATVVRIAWANLGQGDGTPPGSTVAILLNESHITLHTYAKEGWAALNIFTCGEKADPIVAMEEIAKTLGGRILFSDIHERFITVRSEW